MIHFTYLEYFGEIERKLGMQIESFREHIVFLIHQEEGIFLIRLNLMVLKTFHLDQIEVQVSQCHQVPSLFSDFVYSSAI